MTLRFSIKKTPTGMQKTMKPEPPREVGGPPSEAYWMASIPSLPEGEYAIKVVDCGAGLYIHRIGPPVDYAEAPPRR